MTLEVSLEASLNCIECTPCSSLIPKICPFLYSSTKSADSIKYASDQECDTTFTNLTFEDYKFLLMVPSLKNWEKLVYFHECLPKGLTNFGCRKLKLHTLNYHTLWWPKAQHIRKWMYNRDEITLLLCCIYTWYLCTYIYCDAEAPVESTYCILWHAPSSKESSSSIILHMPF